MNEESITLPGRQMLYFPLLKGVGEMGLQDRDYWRERYNKATRFNDRERRIRKTPGSVRGAYPQYAQLVEGRTVAKRPFKPSRFWRWSWYVFVVVLVVLFVVRWFIRR